MEDGSGDSKLPETVVFHDANCKGLSGPVLDSIEDVLRLEQVRLGRTESAFHVLIDRDGSLRRLRDVEEETGLCEDAEDSMLHVYLQGDLQDESLTREQMSVVRRLVRVLIDHGYDNDVPGPSSWVRHNDISEEIFASNCPGVKFPIGVVQNAVEEEIDRHRRLPESSCNGSDESKDLGEEIEDCEESRRSFERHADELNGVLGRLDETLRRISA